MSDTNELKAYIHGEMDMKSLAIGEGLRWIAEIEENERVTKLASRLFDKTVHELIELVEKQAQTAALVEALKDLTEAVTAVQSCSDPDDGGPEHWLKCSAREACELLAALTNGGGDGD